MSIAKIIQTIVQSTSLATAPPICCDKEMKRLEVKKKLCGCAQNAPE